MLKWMQTSKQPVSRGTAAFIAPLTDIWLCSFFSINVFSQDFLFFLRLAFPFRVAGCKYAWMWHVCRMCLWFYCNLVKYRGRVVCVVQWCVPFFKNAIWSLINNCTTFLPSWHADGTFPKSTGFISCLCLGKTPKKHLERRCLFKKPWKVIGWRSFLSVSKQTNKFSPASLSKSATTRVFLLEEVPTLCFYLYNRQKGFHLVIVSPLTATDAAVQFDL